MATCDVYIVMDNDGRIDRSYHRDPIVNRGETVKWHLVYPGEKNATFKVGHFKSACANKQDCQHPDGTPFEEHWGEGEGVGGTLGEPIESTPVQEAAAGGYYKATWTVSVEDKQSDSWDPHIIVHGGR